MTFLWWPTSFHEVWPVRKPGIIRPRIAVSRFLGGPRWALEFNPLGLRKTFSLYWFLSFIRALGLRKDLLESNPLKSRHATTATATATATATTTTTTNNNNNNITTTTNNNNNSHNHNDNTNNDNKEQY